MDELNRRGFLASGTMASLGALALAGAGSMAQAQTSQPASQPAGRRRPGARMAQQAVPGVDLAGVYPGATNAAGQYQLPPLAYPYDAVSEAINEQTMRLHHDKHHAGYVRGLINAEEKLAEARQSGDFSQVDYWSRKAAFHGAGHFLHCIFWDCIGPDASGGGMGGSPEGALAEAIDRDFGGLQPMLDHFAAASKQVEGNGWGIMGYNIPAGKLVILQAMNHQLLSDWAVIPLLVNDVWEHAYYLKYQNERGSYVEDFPKVVNWGKIAQRYELVAGA